MGQAQPPHPRVGLVVYVSSELMVDGGTIYYSHALVWYQLVIVPSGRPLYLYCRVATRALLCMPAFHYLLALCPAWRECYSLIWCEWAVGGDVPSSFGLFPLWGAPFWAPLVCLYRVESAIRLWFYIRVMDIWWWWWWWTWQFELVYKGQIVFNHALYYRTIVRFYITSSSLLSIDTYIIDVTSAALRHFKFRCDIF